MKLSICVVHYYDESGLERFLKSLFQFPPDVDFEVLVVNNGNTRPFENVPKNVKILSPQRNLGFGAGLNLAAKEATGEYLFFGNCDLEIQHFSLSEMLEFFKTHTKAGLIGPKLIYQDGHVQESCRRFPKIFDLLAKRLEFLPFFRSSVERYLMRDLDVTNSLVVDWLVGAALMMPRKLFLDLHGFDERFFLFFEDTDLCRKILKSGFEVWYNPKSAIIHTASQRLSESRWPLLWIFKKAFWIHVMSAIKYYRKWGF